MKMSTIDAAIESEKAELIKQAAQKGICENFGQKQIQKLKKTYIDLNDYWIDLTYARTKIDDFANWCATYTGK